MQPPDYQVLKVKPDDLESALNDMSRQGWDVHTILRAESAGRSFWGRQTLDVTAYHVVFRRRV